MSLFETGFGCTPLFKGVIDNQPGAIAITSFRIRTIVAPAASSDIIRVTNISAFCQNNTPPTTENLIGIVRCWQGDGITDGAQFAAALLNTISTAASGTPIDPSGFTLKATFLYRANNSLAVPIVGDALRLDSQRGRILHVVHFPAIDASTGLGVNTNSGITVLGTYSTGGEIPATLR